MKQLGHHLRFRIDARQIRTFMKIAINTRERQVVEIISAIMFLGDNMLDVEFSEWGIILMELAVFAAMARSFGCLGIIDWNWVDYRKIYEDNFASVISSNARNCIAFINSA